MVGWGWRCCSTTIEDAALGKRDGVLRIASPFLEKLRGKWGLDMDRMQRRDEIDVMLFRKDNELRLRPMSMSLFLKLWYKLCIAAKNEG
jgi:hypothetical protein